MSKEQVGRYTIGDRVRYIGPATQPIAEGMHGTVRKFEGGFVGVVWDAMKSGSGHDLATGDKTITTGWWMYESQIDVAPTAEVVELSVGARVRFVRHHALGDTEGKLRIGATGTVRIHSQNPKSNHSVGVEWDVESFVEGDGHTLKGHSKRGGWWVHPSTVELIAADTASAGAPVLTKWPTVKADQPRPVACGECGGVLTLCQGCVEAVRESREWWPSPAVCVACCCQGDVKGGVTPQGRIVTGSEDEVLAEIPYGVEYGRVVKEVEVDVKGVE
jgi:hypothetical protein